MINAVSTDYSRQPWGCGAGCGPTGGEANYLIVTSWQLSGVNTLEAN